MLGFAITVGFIQLLAAWGCFVLARGGGAANITAAVALGVIDFFLLGVFDEVALLQAIVLFCVGFLFLARGSRLRSFMFASSVLSLAVIVAVGAARMAKYASLRARYPLVSLTPRLEYESKGAHRDVAQVRPSKISPEALAKFDQWYEEGIASNGEYMTRISRPIGLEAIHDSQVHQFINSPGFGRSRGMRPAIDYVELPSRPLLPMSDKPITSIDRLTDDPGQQPLPASLPPPAMPQFETTHRESLVDFVNVVGFGYVRDREHVAGFEPHAFRYNHSGPAAGANEQWLVARLELVSLLKHEQPMVYISEHLPNMEELRTAPTRPLDEFERRSLPMLADDDRHIAAESTTNRIRMLGSVRATHRCTVCHSVELGTLLGAFSYEFHRQPSRPEPPAQTAPQKPPF